MSGMNTATKGYAAPSGEWAWSEIYWSDNNPENYKMGEYTCPKLEPYSIENEVRRVEVITKPDKDLYSFYKDAVSASGKNTIDVNLHNYLVKKAKSFQDRRGFICSAVRQWIIIEVCPVNDPRNYKDPLAGFPMLDIWAFLQPATIGDKAKMKQNLGYVVDDIPRGGWFQARISHVIETGKPYNVFNPHLIVKEKDENGATLKIDKGPVTHCMVMDLPNTKRHGQLNNLRYLFKIEVVIRNTETEEDKKRKNLSLDKYYESLLKDPNSGFTKDQLDKIIRFETGSYLKIWVRNGALGWGKECAITDDQTENCMLNMQKVDSPDGFKLTTVENEFNGCTAMEDDQEDLRKKYGDHYFRPFSYRNHTWKRNLISVDGKYNPKDLYQIGLWPAELIEALETLEADFFATPKEKVSNTRIIGFSLLYVIILLLLHNLIKKSSNPKQKKAIVGIIKYGNLPKLATLFACYGLPSGQQSFDDMVKKLETALKGDPSIEPRYPKFLYHFFCLLKSLAIDSLTVGTPKLSADYKEYLKDREKSWETDKGGASFKEWGLDGKITFDLAKAEAERKLGGSTFPPPYLMWLAWEIVFKASIGLNASIKGELNSRTAPSDPYFKAVRITSDTAGELGIFLDVGAVWSLAKDAEKAVQAKIAVDKKLPKLSNSLEKYVSIKEDGSLVPNETGFAFADTLAKLFEFVDLQIGVAVKLELEGSAGIIIDTLKHQIRVPDPIKYPTEDKDETPPSLTLSFNAPIYGKFSVLSKEFKALHADLLLLTPSALAVFPNGMYVGNSLVCAGSKDLMVRFKNVKLEPQLKIVGSNMLYIGKTIEFTTQSYEAIPGHLMVKSKKNNERGDSTELETPGFALKLLTGTPGVSTDKFIKDIKEIELETKTTFRPLLPAKDYDSLINLKTVFNISDTEIDNDTSYANTISGLLNGNNVIQIIKCLYAQDPVQTSETIKGSLKFIPPILSSIQVTNLTRQNQQVGMADTAQIDISIDNLFQSDFPLHCQVWEVDVKIGVMYGKRMLKNNNKEKGFFTGTLLSPGAFRFNINFGELIMKGNPIVEGKFYDISFRFCADRKGNCPLQIKPELRAVAGDSFFSKIFSFTR